MVALIAGYRCARYGIRACIECQRFIGSVQFAPAHVRRPQALRSQPHHHDQHRAVEQIAVLAEFAQQFRQPDQCDRAEHDPRQAAHAADDDQRQHVDRDQQLEARRIDRRQHGGEDRTRQPGECRAQPVGQQLGSDQIDAQRLRHVLVIAQCHPGAAKAGVLQPPGDERRDRGCNQREIEQRTGLLNTKGPSRGLGICRMPCAPPSRGAAKSDSTMTRTISPRPIVATAR